MDGDRGRRRGGRVLLLDGGVGRPAAAQPRPGVEGEAGHGGPLLVRAPAQHGEAVGRGHDAVAGRPADAGAQPDRVRVGRPGVGEERGGGEVGGRLAADVGRAPRAPYAAAGARGGRDAYDMHDLRGQGDRPPLRDHHVRGVRNSSNELSPFRSLRSNVDGDICMRFPRGYRVTYIFVDEMSPFVRQEEAAFSRLGGGGEKR